MKALFILSLLLTASMLQTVAQDKYKREWSKENSRGKVATITTITSNAAGAAGKPKVLLLGPSVGTKRVYYFDKKGNETETYNYGADGSLANKIIQTYDANGQLIKGDNYEANGAIGTTWSNKYDSKGNKIEKTSNFYGLGYRITDVFMYDNKGNLSEENSSMEYYSSPGTSNIKTIYNYNDPGNEIEFIEYKYGKRREKGTKKFDSKYYLIEEVYYSERCYG